MRDLFQCVGLLDLTPLCPRVAEAENIKLGVEQSQRDRRRQAEHGQRKAFTPLWFHCTEEEAEEGVPR